MTLLTSGRPVVETHGYLTRMFTVLRSSAGAGKTHALVKHYLAHCLRGEVSAYRQVLALTFTNKAAGEMKERVIGNLEKLAANTPDNDALRDLQVHLVKECAADEAAIAHRAEAVLKHMLHHWGDVGISTIDAFTRRVVQPFARDLQLDHDLRMTTEERWYRDRAVDALIAEAGVDAQVTELLSEACQQLLHEERAWDPGAPLRELSSELGNERALAPLRALHGLDPSLVKPLVARLRSETNSFRAALARIGAEAHALIDGAGLTVEDLANGKGGYYGWFKKLRDFGDVWITPGSNTLKTIEVGKWYSSKAGPDARAALEPLAIELQHLYNEAETLREQGQRTYFIRRAVLRELPSAFALDQLDRCLENLKQADGVAFFSDLTRKVSQVVREEPVPYIYERLGERYRHFLIDEFQDTSLLQWHTLLPLIDNALASGGSALIVGDAKQAIYRWRNGEVRLFKDLPNFFPPAKTDLEVEREATLVRNFKAPEPLADNHRSASTIVNFNNALFGPLAEVLPADLRSVYHAHEQHPRKKSVGLVHLEKLEKDKSGEEATGAMLDFLLRSVNETIADGFVPGDIAVLVRSRSLGRTVAAHLIAHGFAVISPDGLRLSGDPVIEGVIDLLRFLHKGDATAATRVLQHQARNNANGASAVDPFEADTLIDPSKAMRAWLAKNGSPSLRTTISALITQLARSMGSKPAEDAQLLTLLDEVHTWTNEHGQDIGGFLEHWERSGGERASAPPANSHAVQVMTVHKAKGLEFSVVIVPNARMASTASHGERLWVRPGDAVSELEHALVRESAALGEAALEELEEEQGLRTLDNLDLLYVAFTRPKQRLYALVPEARADDVTIALLANMSATGDGSRSIMGERTAPWQLRTTPLGEPMTDVGTTQERPVVSVRFEAPESWDPADPDPYRRFGNAVHEVLGRVQHAGMLDGVLTSAVEEGVLDAAEAGPLTARLQALLTSPDLAAYYGEQLTVRTEASIITADGKSHRPDRLVFEGTIARVLDIKTGAPNDQHEEQVRNYMRLLTELGHTHVEGALLYVTTGTLIPLR